MGKTLTLMFVTLFLTGCFSTPEPPKIDLRINKMQLPTIEKVEPVEIPKPPKGEMVNINVDGKQVKAMAFTSEQLKVLMEIQDAAKANSNLVKGQSVLISNIESYTKAIKDLAEMEEARAARLEQELYIADERLRKERLNHQMETIAWKIIAILGLVVGL